MPVASVPEQLRDATGDHAYVDKVG